MSKPRYFDDAVNKIKPGVISEELRDALGVHRDKLPIWIYRMRVLGYPPGYLKQAQVNTLSIFGDGEDGEIPEQTNSSVQQYNKESFIEYPGFNTPVPPGVRDDWYYLRMPPMLETQQLKEALKTMHVTEPVPYKRRKMDAPSTSTSSANKSLNSSVDSNSSKTNANGSQTNGKETSSKSSESALNSTLNSSHNESDGNVLDNSLANESVATNDASKSLLNESTDSERKLRLISTGSPMPASERPTRPSLEKWSVGMGELLYFDNPSDSYTGNYKNKMKGIITKIREKNSQT